MQPQGGAVQTSGATPPVQEQRNAAATPTGSPDAPSQGPQGLSPDVQAILDREKARIYQEAQARADHKIHEARMAAIRETQDRAEQEKLASMDNEEYGQYMREKQERQRSEAAAAQQSQAAFGQSLMQIANTNIEALGDAAVQEQIRARINKGEFPGFPEVFAAIREAGEQVAAKKAEEKVRQQWETTGRAAAERDAQAAVANSATIPTLGAGLPPGQAKKELHGIAAISAGIEEKFKQR